MLELLSPVGNFECLKAAVQNGADAVYFGANLFSARAFAKNFDLDELKQAIRYAKLRNIKTNLTLNTLIKNDEFKDAFNLAKKAYEFGIDAIIVQDLGLSKKIIKAFPNLAVHASTQITAHNLEGVLTLQNIGFKRVVLSRELTLQEIEYICQNSDTEIECFIHGALCISYSGQCLFSSMVGGRSGNRGKCAQACRLPYSLIENETKIDNGYLLSPRDLCGLEGIPSLLKAGVSCLKIEGRMKSPEYVATVTRIYRKYIDLANSDKEYIIDEQDKKDLLQVFNRGGFSTGHLKTEPNKNFVFADKSNNMGIYIGDVLKHNNQKGYVDLKLKDSIAIGDKIFIDSKLKDENDFDYTVSEIIRKNANSKQNKKMAFSNSSTQAKFDFSNNTKQANEGELVTLGRIKGNINIGAKIYKISSKTLSLEARNSFENVENKKRFLNCILDVHLNEPIKFKIFDDNKIEVESESDVLPIEATSSPITEERLIKQISKTNNTPFEFKNITINLDDNLYVPSISAINELRRNALAKYGEKFYESITNLNANSPNSACNCNLNANLHNSTNNCNLDADLHNSTNNCNLNANSPKSTSNCKHISVLLNTLNVEFDYSKLKNVNKIYIPLKFFLNKSYNTILETICNDFNTYIYMPTIMRNNYTLAFNKNIDTILINYKIKGFVLSNIGHFTLLDKFKNSYEFIGNYTLNVVNSFTASALNNIQNCTSNDSSNINLSTVTLSPELNKMDLTALASSININTEFIVYGSLPLMNINYCPLGKSNKCYKDCEKRCLSQSFFYLKDRMGFLFKLMPDNIDTVTTIYNSKVTSIPAFECNYNSARIDILNENIDEINFIINKVLSAEKIEGKDYTNGNYNRLEF